MREHLNRLVSHKSTDVDPRRDQVPRPHTHGDWGTHRHVAFANHNHGEDYGKAVAQPPGGPFYTEPVPVVRKLDLKIIPVESSEGKGAITVIDGKVTLTGIIKALSSIFTDSAPSVQVLKAARLVAQDEEYVHVSANRAGGVHVGKRPPKEWQYDVQFTVAGRGYGRLRLSATSRIDAIKKLRRIVPDAVVRTIRRVEASPF